MLIDLVPRALARPARSLEIFNLLVTLLRSAGEAASPGLDLRETARRLNDLLIGYSPSESAGMALALPRRPAENPLPSQEIQPGSIDLGAFGLVNLLHRLLCNNDDEGVSDVLDFGSVHFPTRFQSSLHSSVLTFAQIRIGTLLASLISQKLGKPGSTLERRIDIQRSHSISPQRHRAQTCRT